MTSTPETTSETVEQGMTPPFELKSNAGLESLLKLFRGFCGETIFEEEAVADAHLPESADNEVSTHVRRQSPAKSVTPENWNHAPSKKENVSENTKDENHLATRAIPEKSQLVDSDAEATGKPDLDTVADEGQNESKATARNLSNGEEITKIEAESRWLRTLQVVFVTVLVVLATFVTLNRLDGDVILTLSHRPEGVGIQIRQAFENKLAEFVVRKINISHIVEETSETLVQETTTPTTTTTVGDDADVEKLDVTTKGQIEKHKNTRVSTGNLMKEEEPETIEESSTSSLTDTMDSHECIGDDHSYEESAATSSNEKDFPEKCNERKSVKGVPLKAASWTNTERQTMESRSHQSVPTDADDDHELGDEGQAQGDLDSIDEESVSGNTIENLEYQDENNSSDNTRKEDSIPVKHTSNARETKERQDDNMQVWSELLDLDEL